jgi:hypothetical protein
MKILSACNCPWVIHARKQRSNTQFLAQRLAGNQMNSRKKPKLFEEDRATALPGSAHLLLATVDGECRT